MAVPVTLLYGGLSGFLLVGLAINVSRLRVRYKASVGQNPPEILRAVRAHGNAAENIPLAIILLAALELSGVSGLMLHTLGGLFVLGRMLHAFGMIAGSRASTLGMTLNNGALFAMSGLAVARHFPH